MLVKLNFGKPKSKKFKFESQDGGASSEVPPAGTSGKTNLANQSQSPVSDSVLTGSHLAGSDSKLSSQSAAPETFETSQSEPANISESSEKGDDTVDNKTAGNTGLPKTPNPMVKVENKSDDDPRGEEFTSAKEDNCNDESEDVKVFQNQESGASNEVRIEMV